tara:strand:- start:1435 stop:1710 length:276 start_codon:yes stop_codon:yes gene_type:complete
MSAIGLSAAEEMEAVIRDRIESLSEQPASEDVVVIAHGPGDDDENLLWINRIQKYCPKYKPNCSYTTYRPSHYVRIGQKREMKLKWLYATT